MRGAAVLETCMRHVLWVGLVMLGCTGRPLILADEGSAATERECFDDPDDSCRGSCFSRQRSYECLERDGAGDCVTECGSRDSNGECEYGIECQEWQGEGEARRCLRRLPMGCQPEI